jgi:hypothetical protein
MRIASGCLALLLSACMTVQQDVTLSCEVEAVEPGWDRTIAPYYFPNRVALFRESLLESSDNIKIVDTADLWQALFPGRDPDADAQVSEFQRADIVGQMASLGIRHMIVLAADSRTLTGEPVMTIMYNTQKESTSSEAVLLTFAGESCEIDRYQAVAEGRDHLVWYYLGVHFDADTPGEALRAITDRMAAYIEQQNPERPVKVAVVAAR